MRMERPKGYSLQAAIAVTRTFTSTEVVTSKWGKSAVRAVLEDIGVDNEELDTCVERLEEEASSLREWQRGLTGKSLLVRLLGVA